MEFGVPQKKEEEEFRQNVKIISAVLKAALSMCCDEGCEEKIEKMINGCGKYEILKCEINEVKLVWL